MIEVEAPWVETDSNYNLLENMTFQIDTFSDMIENGVSEEEAVAHQGETKKSQKKFCGKMQLKESSKLAG